MEAVTALLKQGRMCRVDVFSHVSPVYPAFLFVKKSYRRGMGMDITTPAVHEHEIAKHDDFQYGFEGLVRNIAMLDRMLVSAEKDYIIGGAVTPDAASLGVRIGRMWGNGASLDYPVFHDSVSAAIPVAPPGGGSRIDTVQVQAAFEEYDEQRRAFFNPETESGQYYLTPTKKRLAVKCEIKRGVEGQGAAPETDAGWLKLAEIIVDPGVTGIAADDIKCVTAIYENEENTEWTREKTRTFILGSDLALKSILAKEHTITGEHRQQVIRAANILFGVGNNKVNGTVIPLGQNYQSGNDEFNATDTLYESLVKEIDCRRTAVAALAAAIAVINQTIADMVHEAPDDGAVYGRKNRAWMEVTNGGGGGNIGDAVEALKFYSKKTLMITNARIVDRRKRGWDIGLPYLSPASRVYHFDTDLNDQNQETNLEISAAPADAPELVDAEDTDGHIYFNPAVLAAPPHEMKGRSLYGRFSLKTVPETPTNAFTADMWIRVLNNGFMTVLRFGSPAEYVRLDIRQPDIPYSAAEGGEIEYSAPESASDIPYSAPDAGLWNGITHTWQGGSERVSLDGAGCAVAPNTWIHAAAVLSADTISLYIGGHRFDFSRQNSAPEQISLELNPTRNEFNIDELLLDETRALGFAPFAANTGGRVPYAALDYREKWFVLEAQDVEKVKTNLFETDGFRAAVESVVNNM
ncbi:MAG: hypothetical protein Pg6C_17150 [Treponemataceae bacterium]|nr:MAG: hypothetical protein Pg6C_17150 [Treponemataceae bacterium]